ncbi:unnamed protein product [Nezara viridula]|uniref:Uncharacterized protein n=1 Tax=Nezara viridula TaxID=85310 RepID=A0A9P0HEQ7_NEZVI|nr:unnamed protein product [Nezara viridula]
MGDQEENEENNLEGIVSTTSAAESQATVVSSLEASQQNVSASRIVNTGLRIRVRDRDSTGPESSITVPEEDAPSSG